MVKINDIRVNTLAQHYSQTLDPYTFRDLFHDIHPFLRIRSKQASIRASQWGLQIPSEDFESYYCQGLYQASLGYNSELGEFMPRLQRFLRLREADVYRHYQTRQHDDQGEKMVRYEKAKHTSLDQRVGDEEGNTTLADLVLPRVQSTEQAFFEKYDREHLLGELHALNPKIGSIVLMLDLGYSKVELASAFGEARYNAKMRKMVQRARGFVKTNYYSNKNDAG